MIIFFGKSVNDFATAGKFVACENDKDALINGKSKLELLFLIILKRKFARRFGLLQTDARDSERPREKISGRRRVTRSRTFGTNERKYYVVHHSRLRRLGHRIHPDFMLDAFFREPD